MQKRSKRILAVTLAAMGVVVASGVAYAVWAYSPVASATGSSESFGEVVVTGTWEGRSLSVAGDNGLLPGETGIVKLTLPIPSTNTVNTKVASITAVPFVGTDITAGDPNCFDDLIPATYAPSIVLPQNTTVDINLRDAIKLSDTAPVSCQGMTFQTKWTVVLEATRAGASSATTFNLNPA